MTKELEKAAKKFKKNMQDIVDKNDIDSVSIKVGNGEEVVIAEKQKEEEQPEYNINSKNKLNFTSQLHLACADDNLRPVMCCVCFKDGWAYASDGHILIKQSLELHSIINPEKLEGKAIHKESFKQILAYNIAEVHDDYILCVDEGRKAEFLFSKVGDFPNYEAVIPVGDLEGTTFIGINHKYVNIAGKVLHGSEYGMRMKFRGYNKAIILTTEGYREEQLAIIMPIMLEPTLF